MGEQVSNLLRLKIPSTFINSDLDDVEKRVRYKLLANKNFKLLYAAPERFFVKSERIPKATRASNVNAVAPIRGSGNFQCGFRKEKSQP